MYVYIHTYQLSLAIARPPRSLFYSPALPKFIKRTWQTAWRRGRRHRVEVTARPAVRINCFLPALFPFEYNIFRFFFSLFVPASNSRASLYRSTWIFTACQSTPPDTGLDYLYRPTSSQNKWKFARFPSYSATRFRVLLRSAERSNFRFQMFNNACWARRFRRRTAWLLLLFWQLISCYDKFILRFSARRKRWLRQTSVISHVIRLSFEHFLRTRTTVRIMLPGVIR